MPAALMALLARRASTTLVTGSPSAFRRSGIDLHVELGRAPAHDAGLGHALDAVQARRQLVVRQIAQLGQRAPVRAEAEPDHGEDREGEAVDHEARARRQGGHDLRQAALHQVERVPDVHVPAEEDADLRRAAPGDRADGGDAGDQADRLLDGAGDGQHLHVDGGDAVVDQDDHPGKVGLREQRDRQLEGEEPARQGEGQHHHHQRAPVAIHEAADAGGPGGRRRGGTGRRLRRRPLGRLAHGPASPSMRTAVPSGKE
jgi:hypothetical protein